MTDPFDILHEITKGFAAPAIEKELNDAIAKASRLRAQHDELLRALKVLYAEALGLYDGKEPVVAALIQARLAILRAEGGV